MQPRVMVINDGWPGEEGWLVRSSVGTKAAVGWGIESILEPGVVGAVSCRLQDETLCSESKSSGFWRACVHSSRILLPQTSLVNPHILCNRIQLYHHIFKTYLLLPVYVLECHSIFMEVGGQLVGGRSLFPCVGPRIKLRLSSLAASNFTH